jgi:cytochrome c oxidase assembly protein subunit 15|tara:strand:+ start:290 stop:1327 length:1038 start_codon:yes stop_codon:yes gene_type:complete
MKSLKVFTWIVLINIYLVIVAGSIVRMSGSGMGCPDWPKCFGYLIPPTEQSQLEWKDNHAFEKGQIIILDESLVVAKSNFTTAISVNQNNWESYTKHDYAVFNVYHTWIEYINRLFGALLGFFALLMIYFAAKKWKVNKWFLWLSLIQLFFILFQAWLGKLTVDTNLNPYMITYHMLGVTVMIVIQLLLLKLISRENTQAKSEGNKLHDTIKKVAFTGIVLMIIQIILGTQVRQQTDLMMDAGIVRELIPQGFDYVFYIHRSFSFLLVFAIGYLYLKLKKNSIFVKPLNYLVVFTVLEIIAGIVLFYFGMQAFAQPIHIILAILIYGFFVELFLRTLSKLQSSVD